MIRRSITQCRLELTWIHHCEVERRLHVGLRQFMWLLRGPSQRRKTVEVVEPTAADFVVSVLCTFHQLHPHMNVTLEAPTSLSSASFLSLAAVCSDLMLHWRLSLTQLQMGMISLCTPIPSLAPSLPLSSVSYSDSCGVWSRGAILQDIQAGKLILFHPATRRR